MDKAMIFDTHAHYDDEAFDPDRDELLNSMKPAEWERSSMWVLP